MLRASLASTPFVGRLSPKFDFGRFGCGYRHDNTIDPFWFPAVGRRTAAISPQMA